MTNDFLVEQAKTAIDALFGDKSVSRHETKLRLEDIQEHLEMMLVDLSDADDQDCDNAEE